MSACIRLLQSEALYFPGRLLQPTCCLYQLMALRCFTKSGGDRGLVRVQGSWRRCSCGGRGAAPLRCFSPHLPVAKPA